MASDDFAPDPTTIRDPLLGAQVLGYVLKRRIGAGGMGAVYEAEEPNIGRRAAVKVLLPEVADQAELVTRLKAEARAANAARHRGIVDVFGFATLPDGRNAIVMEYLEGTPLEDELGRLALEGRRLPTLLTLQVLDEVAAVLQAAHAAGVVHRDLKPSNIFLCSAADGSRYVKVLDFGIAKLDTLKDGPQTTANTVLGTPRYMSPEQARGDSAVPSMDLYSLGVLGFELFTGRTPFQHESMVKMLLAHQTEAPPVPSSLAPGLPAVVDAFLLKLLEKDPARRFRSGAEVRLAVQQLRKTLGDTTAAVTEPALSRDTVRAKTPLPARDDAPPVVPRRSPLPWVAGALVLVIGALGAALWRMPAEPALPREPPRPEPTAARDAGAAAAPPAEPDAGAAPTVAAPPVAAEPDAGGPTVAVEPDAGLEPPDGKAGPRPTPRPAETTVSRHAELERRTRVLQARLDAARKRGDSVSLAQEQLTVIKDKLKQVRDRAKLDALETALQRLEEENQ